MRLAIRVDCNHLPVAANSNCMYYKDLMVKSIFYILDINECTLGTDRCAQNCFNTVGSYRCSCNTGYTLNSDGLTCDGT